jgi:hypothetical protein
MKNASHFIRKYCLQTQYDMLESLHVQMGRGEVIN